MTAPLSLLLVGCGRMGSSLLAGWLQEIRNLTVTVIEPGPVRAEANILHLTSADKLDSAQTFDLGVLAVKPQMMDEVCTALVPRLAPTTPLLSIAAGKRLAWFAARCGEIRPLIRAMPNTPAAIGHGITVACANSHVRAEDRTLATTLLKAVGMVEWIEDEALMDAVTAVSGSGPAYVFLLIETLAAAGVKAGLDEPLAMTLARQTVIGAARLAEFDERSSAATLRHNVTSPGGTTEAALKILLASPGGLADLMASAVLAATQRGRALSE